MHSIAATQPIRIVVVTSRNEHWERTLGEAGHLTACCVGDVAAIASHDPAVVVVDGDSENASALVHELRETASPHVRLLVRGSALTAEGVAAADVCVPRAIDDAAFLDTVVRLAALRCSTTRQRAMTKAFGDLVGLSTAMQRVYEIAAQVAPTRATVLVTGESGTGKGALARAIHAASPRARKPFVAVHCAALAETLLESELFGHEKGAFTGAERRRAGRFELAHSGSIFLDEVGEIPPATQVKLLQVLQERTIQRVGGDEPISIDVRLLAATNRNLAADVKEGRFREDLFYRLNVVQIEMPPLRMRHDDLMLLAAHHLERVAEENGKNIRGFTDAARAHILAYAWPGNVRELENAVERAVIVSDDEWIDARDLPVDVDRTHGVARIPGSTLAEIERYAILATLDATGGSTARAAEILGVSVRTVQYRVHEYAAGRTRRVTR